MQAFNTKTASRVTGASERQLRHWDRAGVVRPSVAQAAGRGSRRLYSFLDLVQARAAKQLRDDGLSLQKLRTALRLLRERPEEVKHPLAELRLVTDGRSLFKLTDDPGVLADLLRRNQHVHVFAVAIKVLCDNVTKGLAKVARSSRHRVEVNGTVYNVRIDPDFVDGGFIAECPRLAGCVTDGETKEEALRHMRDAIADWLAAGEEARRAQAE